MIYKKYKNNNGGWIFIDQSFYLNPKGVVISMFCMICHCFLPYRKIFMLPVIFAVSYILITLYDCIYNCDIKMYYGVSPVNITSWEFIKIKELSLIKTNNKF